MVETFRVDHGLYPEDITSLMQAAKTGNPYWKELINPVTKQSGIGKALDSFQNFKRQGFPVSAAGQVFYEPLGKRQTLGSGYFKQGGYPSYRVYAYLFDGSTFVLASDEMQKKQSLVLKPWASIVGWHMRWKLSPTEPSLLQLQDSLNGTFMPLWMADGIGFLHLGNRSAALTRKPAKSLFERPDFQAARENATPRQIVYIQIPELLKLNVPVDKELSLALGGCVRGLEHFILEESVTPEGSYLRFRLKADMLRFDFDAIERCINND